MAEPLPSAAVDSVNGNVSTFWYSEVFPLSNLAAEIWHACGCAAFRHKFRRLQILDASAVLEFSVFLHYFIVLKVCDLVLV